MQTTSHVVLKEAKNISLTIIPVNPLLLLRYISSMHNVATLQGKIYWWYTLAA